MSIIGKIIRVNALPPVGARETNVIYQVAAPGAASYTDYAIDENGDLKTHAVVDGTIPLELADNHISISDPSLTAEGIASQAEYNIDTREKLDLKLDVPSTEGNAQDFPKIIGMNDNGNIAKLPAGDLGKNIANSSLTSVTGAGLTLGANWTLNTSGLQYSITGLSDVSNDSTYNTFLSQNTSGRIGKTNGKQPFLSLPATLSEAERTSWKTAMNGGWTTNTMSVNAVTPLVVDSTKNDDTYITLRGANLNFNPNSFSIKIMDSTGTNVLYQVPGNQVSLNSTGQFLTFYFKFFNQPNGQIVIRLWNGVAEYDVPTKITVSNNINYVDLGAVSWSLIGKDGYISPSSFGNGGLMVYEHPAQISNAEDQAILFAAKTSKLFDKQTNWYLRGSVTRSWVLGSWDTAQSNVFSFLGINSAGSTLALAQDLMGGVKINNDFYSYQSFRTFDNQLEQIASGAAMINFSISKSNNLLQVTIGNKSYTMTLDIDDKDFSFAFFAPNRKTGTPSDTTNKDRTEINLLSAFNF